MNLTLTWTIAWNITLPTCTNLGTNGYFRCMVWAGGGINGAGTLNHSNPRATATIGHLHEPIWNQTPAGWSEWEYLCSNTTNASCHIHATGGTGGVASGSATDLWTFTGFLNASHSYLVSFGFIWHFSTASEHTRGGSMVGGTASASLTLSVKLNSISIA